jgi:hypothetical protein
VSELSPGNVVIKDDLFSPPARQGKLYSPAFNPIDMAFL